MLRSSIIFCSLILALGTQSFCYGFYSNGRWTTTATDDPVAILGRPVTLTWSIIPDGTTIPNVINGQSRISDFVADFDSFYGDSGAGDITNRSWFPAVQQSFDRWSEISGINFVYEPNDDGFLQGNGEGELGVRGDVRLGGAPIDGNGGALAQTGFIPFADITFDTSDLSRYGNLATNSFNLRHTLMHEIGHSIGLGHVESFNSAILLEAFSQTTFEGPQFDDIRGAHHLYGDSLEKESAGGNNSPTTATLLGSIAGGEIISVGVDTPSNTSVINLNQTDFVSISNILDQDYFEFTVELPMTLDVTLSPVGPSYNERINPGQQFSTVDASSMNDLSLQLYSFDGSTASLLHTASGGGVGIAESLSGIDLTNPGDYLVRVAGSSNNVQLYNLSLEAEELIVEPPLFAGDFNEDGFVDAADYTIWRDLLGTSGPLPNEILSPGLVDAADYSTWMSNFGNVQNASISAAIPEPESLSLLTLSLGLLGLVFRKNV